MIRNTNQGSSFRHIAFRVRPLGPQDSAPVASLSLEFGYPNTAAEVALRIESLLRSDRDASFLAESEEGTAGQIRMTWNL